MFVQFVKRIKRQGLTLRTIKHNSPPRKKKVLEKKIGSRFDLIQDHWSDFKKINKNMRYNNRLKPEEGKFLKI
jgi:hypothetical protein